MADDKSQLLSPKLSRRSPSSTTIFLGIVLIAVALYLPSVRSEFIILDDPQYTTSNPYILYPSWGKLAAFFTEVLKPTIVAGYYQPLTMASLMLDRVIEGFWAGAYSPRLDPTLFHLTNILLHALCAGLAFLLFFRIGRSRAAALIAALVFAVHPLNVEVVAWVCQRKALLSMFFTLLVLLAYLQFGQSRRRLWLHLATAAFALSMLSKPTGLLLPCVLLLLDVWPLQRFSRQAVFEKWPLYAIAVVGGWVAFLSQTNAIDLSDAGQHRGFLLTALIACHNLAFYAAKLALPVRLCPIYVLPTESEITPGALSFAAGIAGSLFLLMIFVVAVRRRDRAVWTMLAAFLILIGPTIGPVRFNNAIAADRFAYLPMIAALLLLVECARRIRASLRPVTWGVGILIVGVFAAQTWRQQAVWRSNLSFYHTILERFPQSPTALYGLGNAYLNEYERSLGPGSEATEAQRARWLDQALDAYRKTLAAPTASVDPTSSQAHYRIGYIAILRGRAAEGLEEIKQGLRQPRAYVEGYFFLGTAYSHIGADAEAIAPYEACLQFRPSWIEVRRNLANALLRTGRAREAIQHYERLYELNPSDLNGIQNWAVALLKVGDPRSAIAKLRSVIEIRSAMVAVGGPDDEQKSNLADAYYILAGALAMSGDAPGAIENLRRAAEIKPELLKQAVDNSAFGSLHQTEAWKSLLGGK